MNGESMIGICSLCGSPAVSTCRLCGRLVCEEHYDSRTGICADCLAGKRARS